MVWQCRSKHRMASRYLSALVIYGLCLTPVVSVSPPPSVVAHPGDNVNLQCTNVTGAPGHVGWFKQVNGSEPLCIASMYSSDSTVHHHNGFQPSRMEMLINHRIIFLKITEVDVADSGLYCCGMFDKFIIFTNATVLKVQGHKDSEKDQTEHCEEVADPQMRIMFLLSVIRTGVLLCCLTIFIILYTTRK
uniref:Ig-like domain-containing protein n=1 Tax=Salmo trutta TaxID=8032 RepID=A0A674E203_SALTR